MTTRINYRKDFGRVFGYNLKAAKKPEIITSTLSASNATGMALEMEAVASLSRRCQQPCAHYVLSVADGEKLTEEQWTQAAHKVAEEMGMSQYCAIRHQDTDNDHLHLVGNRVTATGKAWSTSHDRDRMRQVCQDLEEDFGITKTPTRSATRDARIAKDEIERAARLYRDGVQATPIPNRLMLAEQVKATMLQAPSLQAWEQSLKDAGITLRWRLTKAGHPVGVSFASGSERIAGRDAGVSCKDILTHFNHDSQQHQRSQDRRSAPILDAPFGRGDCPQDFGGSPTTDQSNGTTASGFGSPDRGASFPGRDIERTSLRPELVASTQAIGNILDGLIMGLTRSVDDLDRETGPRRHHQPTGIDRSSRQRLRRLAKRTIRRGIAR